MEITPEIVRELLHYDPETGIFTWKARAEHWFKSRHSFIACNARHTGKRAGTVFAARQGYKCRQIGIAGVIVKEHRLAWLCMTDEPLPAAIDHVNRDGTDNRWSNLRASSYIENNRNQSRRRTNTSGATGVCLHSASGKWRARCYIDKKEHCIGYFDSISDAEQAVIAFRARNGFDPSHGSDVAHYV